MAAIVIRDYHSQTDVSGVWNYMNTMLYAIKVPDRFGMYV